MSLPPVIRFVALIRERTGNVVPPARQGFLAEVLERRSRAAGAASKEAYLDALAAAADEEWERLVPLITIKESYFFRAPQQFVAIERQLLPLLVRARAAERRLRVWSVACARGEEPGTLAILLAENELLRGWDWEIVATDVDEEALETARRGIYGERAVSHVPPAQLERWFRPRGKLYELDEPLRRRITYRALNLAHPPYDVVREASAPFDLVLLRNVLIYFRRPLQRRVVALVGEALAPDGALFLGASETLWQIQDRLAAYDLGNCFCYRHRGDDEPQVPLRRLAEEMEAHPEELFPSQSIAGRAGPRPLDDEAPPRRQVVDVPWLDPRRPRIEIGRRPEENGERGARDGEKAAPAPGAAALDAETAPPSTGSPGEAPGGALEVPAVDLAADLAAALDAEADDDAGHLHAEPCGIQDRLLQVARLLSGDRVAEAAERLEEVLEADPSEAAAHALDGFVQDLRGKLDEAISSYRAALYLDPALYQVRLLLADAMGRQGWRERAEHEYRQVLSSLAAGRQRELVPFEELPVPDRRGAEKRARRALAAS